MYLHITPTIHARNAPSPLLESLALHETGLVLGEKDLAVRRPYPNKQYNVLCRRTGNRAYSGLLIVVSDTLSTATVTTRWRSGDRVFEHAVEYRILGKNEICSDEMTLWSKHMALPSIWPKQYNHLSPMHAKPCMEVEPTLAMRRTCLDTCPDRNTFRREECLDIPAMPLSRFDNSLCCTDRLPLLSDAFVA